LITALVFITVPFTAITAVLIVIGREHDFVTSIFFTKGAQLVTHLEQRPGRQVVPIQYETYLTNIGLKMTAKHIASLAKIGRGCGDQPASRHVYRLGDCGDFAHGLR
jgi:hypothetical protein